MDHHVIHINIYDYVNLYTLNVRIFNPLDSSVVISYFHKFADKKFETY